MARIQVAVVAVCFVTLLNVVVHAGWDTYPEGRLLLLLVIFYYDFALLILDYKRDGEGEKKRKTIFFLNAC